MARPAHSEHTSIAQRTGLPARLERELGIAPESAERRVVAREDEARLRGLAALTSGFWDPAWAWLGAAEPIAFIDEGPLDPGGKFDRSIVCAEHSAMTAVSARCSGAEGRSIDRGDRMVFHRKAGWVGPIDQRATTATLNRAHREARWRGLDVGQLANGMIVVGGRCPDRGSALPQ
jgi:hypothetical protein